MDRPWPSSSWTLYGHIARANEKWRRPAAGFPAPAIFLGPDAYVTPSWYATNKPTGVPTWNYVAIHARASCRSNFGGGPGLGLQRTCPSQSVHLSHLNRRIEVFMSLPISSLRHSSRRDEVSRIGRA